MAETTAAARTGTDPSIVVVSTRTTHPAPFRCTGFEWEDVVAEVARATVVSPAYRHRWGPSAERLTRAVTRRSVGRLPGPPTFERIRPTGPPADLLVCYCQQPIDVLILDAIGDLRSWARRAVLFIEEIYLTALPGLRGYHPRFQAFDHVFVSSEETVPALQAELAVPVDYLPFSVDALRFAPRESAGPRPIDVCNIGRRSEITHEALFSWAQRTGRMYYFDSMQPGPVRDHRQHRQLLAWLLQRSAVAISNRGIGSDPDRTRWQASVPPRFFEAAAAGSVLLGVAPDLPGMAACFGWTDAHLPMAFDEPDVGRIVEELLADPERLRAASARNVARSLLAHDHLYRLDAVTAAVGIGLGGRAAGRRERLRARARAVAGAAGLDPAELDDDTPASRSSAGLA